MKRFQRAHTGTDVIFRHHLPEEFMWQWWRKLHASPLLTGQFEIQNKTPTAFKRALESLSLSLENPRSTILRSRINSTKYLFRSIFYLWSYSVRSPISTFLWELELSANTIWDRPIALWCSKTVDRSSSGPTTYIFPSLLFWVNSRN